MLMPGVNSARENTSEGAHVELTGARRCRQLGPLEHSMSNSADRLDTGTKSAQRRYRSVTPIMGLYHRRRRLRATPLP